MRCKVYTFNSEDVKLNVLREVDDVPIDGSVEVIFQNATKQKTLQQLGALFGLWFEEIESHTGDDKDSVHESCKAQFLSKVYAKGHEGKFWREQKNWVDLLVIHQENGDFSKLMEHVGTISLAWATISQTKEYMNRIYAYYINNGIPLSVPDKYHKYYKVKPHD